MPDQPISAKMGEIILYRTDDGQAAINLHALDGSVWLTQAELAELFASTKQNISLHIKNILAEGELAEESVVKHYLTTASDGKQYQTKIFNLEMILALGYRVRSPRGTQFRQWATRHLSEFLVKGFTLDDQKLKNPGGWDYFDELLARIREIRASEKRFYQKVRDLFALSQDYRDDEKAAQLFFAETQNKLLYAVTRQTAAELVLARADSGAPNMALTSWSGGRVRKHDVIIAKNYLSADEVDTLNRLVVIFLEQAELRVKTRHPLTLAYWRENVDRLLTYNDLPILRNTGSVSHDHMKTVAQERFEDFDAKRRAAEAQQAEAEDLALLESLDRRLTEKDPLKNDPDQRQRPGRSGAKRG